MLQQSNWKVVFFILILMKLQKAEHLEKNIWITFPKRVLRNYLEHLLPQIPLFGATITLVETSSRGLTKLCKSPVYVPSKEFILLFFYFILTSLKFFAMWINLPHNWAL